MGLPVPDRHSAVPDNESGKGGEHSHARSEAQRDAGENLSLKYRKERNDAPKDFRRRPATAGFAFAQGESAQGVQAQGGREPNSVGLAG